MREKVILLLPLTYNDGSAVAKEAMEQILQELFVEFGGYTVAGEVEGAYAMRSGAKQVDTCLEVWITVESDDDSLNRLRRMVAWFAAVLRQETMYFERTGSKVEFIAPDSSTQELNEQG